MNKIVNNLFRAVAVTGYIAASCGPCQIAIGPAALITLIATKVINKKIKTLERQDVSASNQAKIKKLLIQKDNINFLFSLNLAGCLPVVGPLMVAVRVFKCPKGPSMV